jgi:teichuronic acid biosynthesis glycosyltransferase TuaH
MTEKQSPLNEMNPTWHKIDNASMEADHSPVIKGRDIVIVGLQPWYFPTGCNCKNMALHFARHNRVLYVNFPIKRKAYLEKTPDPKIEKHIQIIKENGEKIRSIGSNIWELYPHTLVDSVNGLPSTKVMKVVNYINNRRFAKNIKAAMAVLGFKDIILFNDNDVYNGFYLKELLSPSLSIYYFRDFLQGYDYWKKHTRILEPQLIKKSDLVVANSEYYSEYSAPINRHSYYIGQGCSFEYFDHTKTFPVPEDIKKIKSPIIGYIGALDSARLDLGIIETIAKSNQDWNVVLVGPEDDVFKGSALHDIPNIHFLGGKPFDMLPAYVQSFDVCINPQVKNQITKGNYPLKIDEYLAMGKPVIATKTRAMGIFEAHTYQADHPHEYPELIKKALVEDDEEKRNIRISFAQSHTWENCMMELYKAVAIYSKNKAKSS